MQYPQIELLVPDYSVADAQEVARDIRKDYGVTTRVVLVGDDEREIVSTYSLEPEGV